MAKKKTKIAAPIKSLKGQEIAYQKQLNKLGRMLVAAVRSELLPYLKTNQELYVADGIGADLTGVFESLTSKFTGPVVTSFAKMTASNMVEKVEKTNRTKFNRMLSKAIGVDLGSIIATEGLEDFVELNINKNVSLIKSLPEEYLKQVETIVSNGVVNGLRYSEIEKQIAGGAGTVNAKLANRIKTINSQITLRRSEALGIKKGIWRTSEDERVRGNPNGKYPNAIPSHFRANGKEFELSKGLKIDGEWILPGIPINCRCTYSPIINIEAS